jgi:hypothetical protein
VVLGAFSDAGRPTGSAEVDLGGTVVATWTYGGVLPGRS